MFAISNLRTTFSRENSLFLKTYFFIEAFENWSFGMRFLPSSSGSILSTKNYQNHLNIDIRSVRFVWNLFKFKKIEKFIFRRKFSRTEIFHDWIKLLLIFMFLFKQLLIFFALVFLEAGPDFF